MRLEEKIQCFEDILQALIVQNDESDAQSKDHILRCIDRIVALQKIITLLRNRKILIDKNMMCRGDNE
jgi:hypothetical protein